MKSIDYYKKNIKFLVGDNFTVEFEENGEPFIGVAATITRKSDNFITEAVCSGRNFNCCYEVMSNQIQGYALEELSFENYFNKHF